MASAREMALLRNRVERPAELAVYQGKAAEIWEILRERKSEIKPLPWEWEMLEAIILGNVDQSTLTAQTWEWLVELKSRVEVYDVIAEKPIWTERYHRHRDTKDEKDFDFDEDEFYWRIKESRADEKKKWVRVSVIWIQKDTEAAFVRVEVERANLLYLALNYNNASSYPKEFGTNGPAISEAMRGFNPRLFAMALDRMEPYIENPATARIYLWPVPSDREEDREAWRATAGTTEDQRRWLNSVFPLHLSRVDSDPEKYSSEAILQEVVLEIYLKAKQYFRLIEIYDGMGFTDHPPIDNTRYTGDDHFHMEGSYMTIRKNITWLGRSAEKIPSEAEFLATRKRLVEEAKKRKIVPRKSLKLFGGKKLKQKP
jgi:hypothetical protein